MKRRSFLKSLAAARAATLALTGRAEAALPKAKITRVRIYKPPNLNQIFNQSNMMVTVETDIGITGVGEGGAKDTLEQCAGTLIGKNPFRIEAIWQEMYIAWFYPPGREKIHALGALDLALWDIKGKALKLPVHELLGGAVRHHCECYGTSYKPQPAGGRAAPLSLRERARAAMEEGYRVFRIGAGDTAEGGTFNSRERVHKVAQDGKEVREGVGKDGDWMIDFHQRFDFNDGLRACKLLEEFEPYLVEDPVRDEHAREDLPKLRQMTSVPLAHGEEWGQRYDFNKLVENHDIDYIRATLPNVGGITEMMKIAAICETHAVGIVPHFTGPIATAALVNCLSTFPGPVLMEYNYGGRPIDYLPECLDFKAGKAYRNDRPGLGVTPEMKLVTMIGEVTQPGRRNVFFRPDGSLTHW
ncbi:MAG TPA: mandelate racemase/muconate lactonizing enzyme family protein [Bryobacteraceae bacterium]|nr:mandelate racemase/muconate lactonizing enzyme family protein [Bryobacteraceae bacterium]